MFYFYYCYFFFYRAVFETSWGEQLLLEKVADWCLCTIVIEMKWHSLKIKKKKKKKKKNSVWFGTGETKKRRTLHASPAGAKKKKKRWNYTATYNNIKNLYMTWRKNFQSWPFFFFFFFYKLICFLFYESVFPKKNIEISHTHTHLLPNTTELPERQGREVHHSWASAQHLSRHSLASKKKKLSLSQKKKKMIFELLSYASLVVGVPVPVVSYFGRRSQIFVSERNIKMKNLGHYQHFFFFFFFFWKWWKWELMSFYVPVYFFDSLCCMYIAVTFDLSVNQYLYHSLLNFCKRPIYVLGTCVTERESGRGQKKK